MHKLAVVSIIVGLMAGCTLESEPTHSPVKVEIRKTAAGYQLMRGGEPYVVRGAGMPLNDFERFAAAGGNSIRTWNTSHRGQDPIEFLDAAAANGITVALGLPMVPERHGFDYDDPVAVAAQLEAMREEVLKYRNHPAVLVWVIGNELNHDYTNPRVYDAVNDVAAMIAELDPYHPSTTTTSGFRADVNTEILARAPALDFLSFQLYGSLFALPQRLEESGFDKPFMVTEWGTIGYWEVPKTDWETPVEMHSSDKASIFRRGYEEILAPLDGQLLGSYAFYWGQKQERTPTWFGMLTENGNLTEAVDVMQYSWTGSWPTNRTPQVQTMLLDGKTAVDSVRLSPDQKVDAVIDIRDPDGDTLTYRWELKPESTATTGGGDYEEPLLNLEGYIVDAGAARTSLTTPSPGKYRLFAYATDPNGRVAHANIPFLVEADGSD